LHSKNVHALDSDYIGKGITKFHFKISLGNNNWVITNLQPSNQQ